MDNEEYVKLTNDTCDRFLQACREAGGADDVISLQALMHRVQYRLFALRKQEAAPKH